MYELRGKVLAKFRKSVKRFTSRLDNKLVHRMVRDEAHQYRKILVQHKGNSVVDAKVKKQIKEYCFDKYGSSSYWPWLAFYTEMRGEFLEGWIPYDYYRFNLLPSWNPKKELSGLKTFDYRIYKDFAVEPLAVRIGGNLYDSRQNDIGIEQLISKAGLDGPEIVIKCDGGRGGKNTFFIKKGNLKESLDIIEGNLVIQPLIKQHEILNQLYPHSVNTVRFATFLEYDGSISTKFISLRFGQGGSRVDNSSSGGYSLLLGQDGTLISGIYDDIKPTNQDRHPDTGFEYKNLKIPAINEASKLCSKAHLKFPYARFIAWDVCIDEHSKPVLLEWNTEHPAMWFAESLNGPLWPDLV